jgi:hypothetical protein
MLSVTLLVPGTWRSSVSVAHWAVPAPGRTAGVEGVEGMSNVMLLLPCDVSASYGRLPTLRLDPPAIVAGESWGVLGGSHDGL